MLVAHWWLYDCTRHLAVHVNARTHARAPRGVPFVCYLRRLERARRLGCQTIGLARGPYHVVRRALLAVGEA